MQRLSSELQDLILFPKYFKPISKVSFNQKICMVKCFDNISNINNQIKSLVNEYNYQRTRSGCNIWKNTQKPIYKYLLYKILDKKPKKIKNNSCKNELINCDSIYLKYEYKKNYKKCENMIIL
tara:strand:- start:2529 stop:2897 length:369 start_codon:yes stop_codon:yes gene_type:complete